MITKADPARWFKNAMVAAALFIGGFLAGRSVDSRTLPIGVSWPRYPANSPCSLNDVEGDSILRRWKTGACSYSADYAVFVVDRRGKLDSWETKVVALQALNNLFRHTQRKLMRELSSVGAPETPMGSSPPAKRK